MWMRYVDDIFVLEVLDINEFAVKLMADKVFDPSCSNQKVYEEGAGDVALSVLSGINGNRDC